MKLPLLTSNKRRHNCRQKTPEIDCKIEHREKLVSLSFLKAHKTARYCTVLELAINLGRVENKHTTKHTNPVRYRTIAT